MFTNMLLLMVLELFIVSPVSSYVLPPVDTAEKNVPTCTAYDKLCGINYRYISQDGEPVEYLGSQSDICACADNVTCNTDWNNDTNSIIQKLYTGTGLQLEAKTSYCQIPQKQNPCSFGFPVFVTKGYGQFSFKLATPMMCKCSRSLYAHASWQDGAYHYIQYGCGQPRCAKRQMMMCGQVRYVDAGNFSYRYLCRCRRDELCMGTLPKENVPITDHTCQKQPGLGNSTDESLTWESFRP